MLTGSPYVYGGVLANWTDIAIDDWFLVSGGSSTTYAISAISQRSLADAVTHNPASTWALGDLVKVGTVLYVALQAVPADTDITNTVYWRATSGWRLTLTASYGGASAESSYGIMQDFTAHYGLPLPAQGDVNSAGVLRRMLTELDTLLYVRFGSPPPPPPDGGTDQPAIVDTPVSPEGVTAAKPGRFYVSSSNKSFWVKLTGSSSTGWLELIGGEVVEG